MGSGGSKYDKDAEKARWQKMSGPPTTVHTGPRAILVPRGHENQVTFSESKTLQSDGGVATMACSSHKGFGLVVTHANARSIYTVNYYEVGFAETNAPMTLRRNGPFLINDHLSMALDIGFGKMNPYNVISVVQESGSISKTLRSKGRKWIVNADGTVSPETSPDLVLGFSPPRLQLVVGNCDRALRVTNGQQIAAATSDAAAIPLMFGDNWALSFAELDESVQNFDEWSVTPALVREAHLAARVSYPNGFLCSHGPRGKFFALDVAMWQYLANQPVNFVAGANRSRTCLNGGGRSWFVRPDGCIQSGGNSTLFIGCDCYIAEYAAMVAAKIR